MDRWITEDDRNLLDESLKKDVFHKTTTADFFYAPGTFCKVYEDEKGPVLFLRACKSLRLDIQFLDNYDIERNKAILQNEFTAFALQCKSAGFLELVFNTTSPHLKRFCKNTLGFQIVEGDELRFLL